MVELTREHVQYAERIAWKHSTPENFEDICGYAMIGLVQAAERFDPSHGSDFLAYASSRIRGAAVDGARELDRLSRRDRHREGELGDLLRRRVSALLELDAPIPAEDGEIESAYEVIPNPDVPDPLEEAIATDRQEAIAAALTRAIDSGALTVLQAMAVTFRYYDDGMTQREIGEVLGVTESRVCQLLGGALEKLAQNGELLRAAA
jgi:RNA polymerase sigma factor for flagellar operon FliA